MPIDNRPRRSRRWTALYVTDGTAVYAITVSATGMIRTGARRRWRRRLECCNDVRVSRALRRLSDEEGTTLIETTIACGILLVTLAGLMSMGTLATMHTENQGHLAPRTTEYAQDKMEQLLALAYGDSASDTVVFPAASSGGTGLAVGGSTNTAAPGQRVRRLAGERRQPARRRHGAAGDLVLRAGLAGHLRRDVAHGIDSRHQAVTVTVTVRSSVGGFMLPKSTIVALKASQF